MVESFPRGLWCRNRHRWETWIKWQNVTKHNHKITFTFSQLLNQLTPWRRRKILPWRRLFYFLSQQLNVPLYSPLPFAAVGWKTLENNTSDKTLKAASVLFSLCVDHSKHLWKFRFLIIIIAFLKPWGEDWVDDERKEALDGEGRLG